MIGRFMNCAAQPEPLEPRHSLGCGGSGRGVGAKYLKCQRRRGADHIPANAASRNDLKIRDFLASGMSREPAAASPLPLGRGRSGCAAVPSIVSKDQAGAKIGRHPKTCHHATEGETHDAESCRYPGQPRPHNGVSMQRRHPYSRPRLALRRCLGLASRRERDRSAAAVPGGYRLARTCRAGAAQRRLAAALHAPSRMPAGYALAARVPPSGASARAASACAAARPGRRANG